MFSRRLSQRLALKIQLCRQFRRHGTVLSASLDGLADLLISAAISSRSLSSLLHLLSLRFLMTVFSQPRPVAREPPQATNTCRKYPTVNPAMSEVILGGTNGATLELCVQLTAINYRIMGNDLDLACG